MGAAFSWILMSVSLTGGLMLKLVIEEMILSFLWLLELRMKRGMCQRDNNPTIEETTGEGHQ